MELTGCKKTGIYRFPVYIDRNLSGSLWDMKGVNKSSKEAAMFIHLEGYNWI